MRIALALTAIVLAGCDTGTEERTEVASTRVVQRSFVAIPPGTLPRGSAAQAAALEHSPPLTPQLIARGMDRFLIFCSPCHGVGGRGDGPVTARGFSSPPTYFEERLKALPADGIVAVITHGKGRMFSYAATVPPEDRWAIAHYVKDLQARSSAPAPAGGTPP